MSAKADLEGIDNWVLSCWALAGVPPLLHRPRLPRGPRRLGDDRVISALFFASPGREEEEGERGGVQLLAFESVGAPEN